MKHNRSPLPLLAVFSIVALAALALPSCVAPEKARLTTLNIGKYSSNWDEILISKVDGRRIEPPQASVTISAGKRTVSFIVSYMRGDLAQPIVVDVPVTAYFAPNHQYKAHVDYQTGLMGALIAEESDGSNGNGLTAGALVYSREFDEYGQRHKRRNSSRP